MDNRLKVAIDNLYIKFNNILLINTMYVSVLNFSSIWIPEDFDPKNSGKYLRMRVEYPGFWKLSSSAKHQNNPHLIHTITELHECFRTNPSFF